MRLGQGCRRRSPWWCWAVMVGTAAVVLPGGAFVVSGEKEKDGDGGSSAAESQQARQGPTGQAVPPNATAIAPQDKTTQRRTLQTLKAPFQLTQAEQAQVDSVLTRWEQASQNHKRIVLEFNRFEFKRAFSVASNTPMHIDRGEMGFTSSGEWMWHIDGEWVGEKLVEGQRAERMVFDGESVYEFDYRRKTVSQFILAEDQLIMAKAMNELMGRVWRPFLFAIDMADLKERFFIRLLKLPDKEQICIDAWPRRLEEARNCRNMRMIIDASKMEPVGLMVTLPNGTDDYRYQFTKVEINPTIPVDLSHDPFKVKVPSDWRTYVVEIPNTQSPDR